MQGFEEILADEMTTLGATEVQVAKRAVTAQADLETIYKINYRSYFALRILMNIHTATIRTANHLYKQISSINWDDFIDLDQTFAIRTTVYSDHFTHSHFVALKAKDAIADYFMNKYDKRPNVDTSDPDIVIDVHIAHDNLNVSLDSSGESLHKRGYKIEQVKAPINEVLAAGLIKLSGWDTRSVLWDPMCGSGTFLSEALLQAFKIPPQSKYRDFCFKNWSNFDQDLWKKVCSEADEQIDKNQNVKVKGSDISTKSINATKYNLAELGLLEYVTLEKKDFLEHQSDGGIYHVIMNPPYDERLELDDVIETYNSIGTVFKHQLTGSTAWIISAHIKAIKRVGLKPSKKITVFNGPLESRFHKFEMYAGSKKR